jgi:dihydroxy-acid dehydratase
VTDGQLSGPCLRGLTVAQVAPEVATGGAIGKVRTGDTIRISVERRSIDIDVPPDELAAREAPGYVNPATG